MAEMTCEQIEELATEYAFEILSASETKAVSAHVLRCPACRLEIEEIKEMSRTLLDLIPEVEAPSSLEQQAMARLQRSDRHRFTSARTLIAVAAAVVMILGVVVVSTDLGRNKPTAPSQLAGALHQGANQVGTVTVESNPTWVTMTIDDLSYTGPITCQVISRDGQISTVGTFQLVSGSGSWETSDPVAISSLVAARVISPSGAVLATATLTDKQ